MLTIVFLPLLMTAAPDAAAYAVQGDAHLKAADVAERPLEELQHAHTSFENAYLVDEVADYLCRALAVADRALRTGGFADEQERLFWEETRRDDLERLQEDAVEKKRRNCRFDAAGKPPAPRVVLLEDGDFPTRAEVTPMSEDALPRRQRSAPSPVDPRRQRAHTAAGVLLTSAGVGLLGALAGVLELERQRIAEMKGLVADARGEGRLFTVDEHRRFGDLRDAVFRDADVAIGVGVAGVASLGVGVALLATRKKARTRAYALQPYGGPHGAGAVLRLRF